MSPRIPDWIAFPALLVCLFDLLGGIATEHWGAALIGAVFGAWWWHVLTAEEEA